MLKEFKKFKLISIEPFEPFEPFEQLHFFKNKKAHPNYRMSSLSDWYKSYCNPFNSSTK